MMQYTGFIYIWYDRKRKWFYIGSHMGTSNDGYIGSNTRLQRAYSKRPEDFRRKILQYYYGDSGKKLLQMEQNFLDRIKYEELHLRENLENNTTRYYNIKPTAAGLTGRVASELKKTWWESEASNEWRDKLSANMKINNPSQIAARSVKGFKPWNTGIKAPQISAAKKGVPSNVPFEVRSQISKKAWADGCFDNRQKPSEETKRKISETSRALNRKQTVYQRQRAREANLGRPKSEEQKRKMSENQKERYTKMEICPNCGLIGSGPAMQRWHMGNCRK